MSDTLQPVALGRQAGTGPCSPAPARSPEARAALRAAEQALLDERRLLTEAELADLAHVPDASVPSLAALAHEVRLAWCGPEVEVEGILSAKTGGCPEDCHFCSQSAQFDTPVKATPFLDTDEVLAAARETAALGASEFCIVLAVRGPDERTMHRILELVPVMQVEAGLNVAVSAGILSEDQARRLAEGGVHRYNHNLETARSFFGNVVTSHTFDERLDTCRMVSATAWSCAAVRCSGMGESVDQRIELLGALRALDPAEVPLNFLNPRPGTPLAERRRPVEPLEAIRWIALFRLALPSVILRYAGGREVTLRELQAMGMTCGHQRPDRRQLPHHAGSHPRPRTSRCSTTSGCPSARSARSSEHGDHRRDRRRRGVPLHGLRSRCDRVPGMPRVHGPTPVLPSVRHLARGAGAAHRLVRTLQGARRQHLLSDSTARPSGQHRLDGRAVDLGLLDALRVLDDVTAQEHPVDAAGVLDGVRHR